jgi:hypothetical protein
MQKVSTSDRPVISQKLRLIEQFLSVMESALGAIDQSLAKSLIFRCKGYIGSLMD